MAKPVIILKQAVKRSFVPLLVQRGFHPNMEAKDQAVWHFRRPHNTTADRGAFDALDICFSSGREREYRPEKAANIVILLTTFDGEYIEKALRVYEWKYIGVTTHTHRVGVRRIRKNGALSRLFRSKPSLEPFFLSETIDRESLKNSAEMVVEELIDVLPQIDAWFKDGTLGPNMSLTVVPLKFAQ